MRGCTCNSGTFCDHWQLTIKLHLTILSDPRFLEEFIEVVECFLISVVTGESEERQCLLAVSCRVHVNKVFREFLHFNT